MNHLPTIGIFPGHVSFRRSMSWIVSWCRKFCTSSGHATVSLPRLGIPNTRCPHHCDAAPQEGRWEYHGTMAPWLCLWIKKPGVWSPAILLHGQGFKFGFESLEKMNVWSAFSFFSGSHWDVVASLKKCLLDVQEKVEKQIAKKSSLFPKQTRCWDAMLGPSPNKQNAKSPKRVSLFHHSSQTNFFREN